ncbi:MAG: UbiD family decarboxylase domain-containing protein [Desulfurococcaceae archaeon]
MSVPRRLSEYSNSISRILGRKIEDLGAVKRETAVANMIASRTSILKFRAEGSDFEIYANILASRRELHLLFGTSNDDELYGKLLEAVEHARRPTIDDFSKYYRRVDADLSSLPFLRFFEEDGGPYLTGSIVVACWEGVCNASFHRVMYRDRLRATLRIVPRHLHYIVSKYHGNGKDAPAAIILGANPIYEVASAMSPPLGTYEIFVGAALSGEDRLVLTPEHKIPVPASAGAIVEGKITRELDEEGPFVDILGVPDEKRMQPVFVPENIYYNVNGPEYHAIVPSLTEHLLLMGFPREPFIYRAVKSIVPGLRSVRLSRGGSGWLTIVLSLEQRVEGEGLTAAIAALSAHPSAKVVIVVDHDIDPDDPVQVEWAIATRTKPGDDVVILRNLRGSTMDPRSKDGLGDKLIILALKPFGEPWDKYRRVRV